MCPVDPSVLSVFLTSAFIRNCAIAQVQLYENMRNSTEKFQDKSLKTRREKVYNFSKVSCIAIVYRQCSSVLTIVFSNQL